MLNYVMLHKGEATDTVGISEEQAAGVMAKWGDWIEKVGPQRLGGR